MIYIKAFKSSVNIGFWRGESMQDKYNLLSGTGDRMRHVKISTLKEIKKSAIADFTKQAIRLNEETGQSHNDSRGKVGLAMCRSIKQLRHAEVPTTEQEMYEAALQFVRKVSGYRVPSQKNRAAFDQAVTEIAATTRLLLEQIGTPTRVEN